MLRLVGQPASILCLNCLQAPPPFRRVVSFATYRGPLRSIVHAYKYKRIRSLAHPLGRLLAGTIATLAADPPQPMLVVPVPLHPRRLRRRGFNQSRLLATSALRSLRRSHPHWQLSLSPASLVRQRETAPQVTLQRSERWANLEQAFHVSRPQQITGRTVLLIDDIVTTGATVDACARALLAAGATAVLVASLARAQGSPTADGPDQLLDQLGDESDARFADFWPNPADAAATRSPVPEFTPDDLFLADLDADDFDDPVPAESYPANRATSARQITSAGPAPPHPT